MYMTNEKQKTERTSVTLTDRANEIRDKLTVEWTLQKVLSASLEVFGKLDYYEQKKAIISSAENSDFDIESIDLEFEQRVREVLNKITSESEARAAADVVARAARKAEARSKAQKRKSG
jgi:hypothetical protein